MLIYGVVKNGLKKATIIFRRGHFVEEIGKGQNYFTSPLGFTLFLP